MVSPQPADDVQRTGQLGTRAAFGGLAWGILSGIPGWKTGPRPSRPMCAHLKGCGHMLPSQAQGTGLGRDFWKVQPACPRGVVEAEPPR